MKLALILALISGAAFAQSITENVKVECVMSDVTTLRQFSLAATFDLSSGKFENKDLDLTLRVLGPSRETNDVSVTRDGNIVSYPAEVITKNPFYVITTVDKDAEVQLINVLVDFPTKLASIVRLSTGETFRSTCKSVK